MSEIKHGLRVSPDGITAALLIPTSAWNIFLRILNARPADVLPATSSDGETFKDADGQTWYVVDRLEILLLSRTSKEEAAERRIGGDERCGEK
jgi:hypothetical protein